MQANIIHISKGIQPAVIRKAVDLLDTLDGKVRKPVRKLKESNYLVVSMGIRHRLLNRGKGWELLTHEQYNRYVTSRKVR